MKLVFQIAVCAGLSIIFQKLLFAYWTHNEGQNHNHKSDAWVFGVIAAIVIGLLVVEGLFSVYE